MKIPIIVDGRMVQIDKGTPVIGAAKKAGITIPTLCYHESLKPYGACRLCIVEVLQNKQRKLVTSCNYSAEAGMEIFTDTARVRGTRKMLIELLLARCPDVPAVQNMARQMGIETSRLKKIEDKECILCGLCVRFCEEVVGVNAIGLSNRGIEREVATPYKSPSDTCICCGSCSYICPAGCIEMMPDKETPGMYAMKPGRLSLEPCPGDYRCRECDTDRLFVEEMKTAISRFRSRLEKA